MQAKAWTRPGRARNPGTLLVHAPAVLPRTNAMRAGGGLALALALAMAGCGRKEPDPPPKPTNAPAASNPLTAPADYLGAVGQAQRYSAKAVDLASVSKAIQMFHAAEDRYPKDLNELIKEQYLPALPALPKGMKYTYNPANGQVKAVQAQ
jgi:predicted small lipoprotein YifL